LAAAAAAQRVRLRIVALAALALAVAAPAARATAVSSGQLRALAARATADPAALAQLRAVDRVDGRPVDVRGALAGADPAQLRARLAVLAAGAAAAPRAGDARADARSILAERRFHGTHVPGPFRSLLDRVAHWLRSLGGVVSFLDRLLPGGRSVVWVVLAVLIGLVAGLVARRTLTGRAATAARDAAASRPAAQDPRALERRAAEAEAAGDHALAVRLRFRAGLLRLRIRPSTPTAEVARTLRSEDFDALARTFDEVVYGGRPAHAADAADARERWPRVVADAPEEALR
jgi:hypothetical protein